VLAPRGRLLFNDRDKKEAPMPQTPPVVANLPLYGDPISLDQAKAVMEAAEAEAAREGWPMVIAIVDSACNLVMLHRMDQAQLGSIEIARQKAETSVRFRRPTRAFQDVLAEGGVGLRLLGMTNMLPLEGGLPLVLDGRIVGAIGVSGMASAQDAQVARAGLVVLV
jgi:glc operon protein GlcG